MQRNFIWIYLSKETYFHIQKIFKFMICSEILWIVLPGKWNMSSLKFTLPSFHCCLSIFLRSLFSLTENGRVSSFLILEWSSLQPPFHWILFQKLRRIFFNLVSRNSGSTLKSQISIVYFKQLKCYKIYLSTYCFTQNWLNLFDQFIFSFISKTVTTDLWKFHPVTKIFAYFTRHYLSVSG